MLRTFAVLSLLTAAACSDDAPSELPVFPTDYAASYQEVRNCRFSLDHDLGYIRVLASPDAMAAYTSRTGEFPTGAILLKEEFDGGDTTCSESIIGFSVMQKVDPGTAPDELDWTWQKVDASKKKVVTEDRERCISCHRDCGSPPDGYLNTCATP